MITRLGGTWASTQYDYILNNMKIGEFSRNDNDQDWKRKSVMTNLTPDIIPTQ